MNKLGRLRVFNIMLQIKYKFELPKIKIEKYIKSIEQHIAEQQEQAIRKWLIAALSKVPTYTGAARFTFKPVGRIVNRAVRRGRVKGSSDPSKKKVFKYAGQIYPLPGEYGEASISKKRTRDGLTVDFRFSQSLPYVLWNEIQPGPSWFPFKTPPPWHALTAGREAYEKFIDQVELPDYLRFRDVVIITT